MIEDYKDSEGNPRSLRWMVRNEPGWAESRLRFMRADTERLTGERDALKAELAGITELCARACEMARDVNWAADVDWREVLKFAEDVIRDIGRGKS